MEQRTRTSQAKGHIHSEEEFCGVLEEKYLLLRKVGSGGTSSVYLGYNKFDDERTLTAIKMINPEKQDTKVFKAEVEMLKKIDHQNIVKIIDSSENARFNKSDGRCKLVNYIVLEYIKNGELFDFIFFPQKGFGEELGRVILLKIIEGLSACHKAGVVHRDLKTENIMLTENFEIKIADFGFAAYKQGKDGKGLLYTSLGTPNYAAPELHTHSPYYGVCNDIFSLAVTLFVIVTGSMPFKTATQYDPFYSLIIQNDYEAYWTKRNIKVPLTDNFKSLFINLIAFDYSQRPTIEEILAHPWILNSETEDVEERLRFDFYKRKQVVDFKRMKAQLQKEEEKKGNKVVIQRAYRSFENSPSMKEEMKLERILNDYEEMGNRYTLIFEQGSDPQTLFRRILAFFEVKTARVKSCTESYRTRVLFLEEDMTNSEECNPDGFFFLHNLKMFVEIKKYENDKLIVEFTKRSGDKYKFFNTYEEFCNSFN